VRMIVQLLIAENERMMQQANALENGLDRSRRQIEQLQTSLAVAEEIGTRDALTSIANRRQFDKVLAAAVAGAQAEQLALCLVMADIDHFKQINDKHGHVAGDKVLQDLANLLTNNVKGRDTVARYGGEEFAIILPQTTIGDAYHLTEQIRSRLEASDWRVGHSNRPLGRITASFGIAQLDDGDDPASLIERADAKLYDSKRLGRNRITLDASARKQPAHQPPPASLVQA
jgi:diguanylate cyclase